MHHRSQSECLYVCICISTYAESLSKHHHMFLIEPLFMLLLVCEMQFIHFIDFYPLLKALHMYHVKNLK